MVVPVRALRILLLVAAVVLLGYAVASAGLEASRRAELERMLDATLPDGLSEETERELAREGDLDRAELLAARTLFARALDTRDVRELSPDELDGWIERRLELLSRARELAFEGVRARPAAWQGLMIYGGSIYLERSLRQDRTLVTRHRDWEAPLLRALELSGGAEEPQRLLAMAYLEVWPILSPAKRQTARELVSVALRDPESFRALLDPWLLVAADLDDAFEVLPDSHHVWQQVARRLESRGDWPRYCDAWTRARSALLEELEVDLTRAADRMRGGDSSGARLLLLSVLREAPAEEAFLPLIRSVFEILPAGPIDRQLAPQLRPWLVWALDRCLFDECPLPASALGRMAGSLPDDEVVLRARALLVEGRLPDAERLERSTELWQADWAPYLLQKVPLLISVGRTADARKDLERLHPEWQGHPLHLDALRRLDVPVELDAAAAVEWPTYAWWASEGRRQFLDLQAAHAAPGLWLELAEVPKGGGAIELLIDGRSLGCRALPPGADHLELDHTLNLRPHRLELGALAGGRVLPGPVSLLDLSIRR